MKKVLWFIIKSLGLRCWFAGDVEFPNEDDWRNPFWRLTEHLAVKVIYAISLIDFRLIYRDHDLKWHLFDWRLPYKTEQNVYNALFSIHLQIVIWRKFAWPKLWIFFRPCHKYYFIFSTPGILFDRGELHFKLAIMNWEKEKELGCNEPYWWDEGAI